MKPWIAERLLWSVAIGATLSGVVQVGADSKPSEPPRIGAPQFREVFMYDAAQLSATANAVASGDSFGLDPSQSVSASSSEADPMASPTPPAQNLVVTGLSGGPPWRAIVSGIPGHVGSFVVHDDDTLGGIRIRAIRRDTVVMETKDSAVTLILRR